MVLFEMGNYREFILVVHMTVCLSNLLGSIAYEVGNDGIIGSEVDKHGNKRMAEVMDADAFHACHCDVLFEIAGKRCGRDWSFAAEEERGFPLIIFEFCLRSRAERDFLHLIRLCGYYFERCLVERSESNGFRDKRTSLFYIFGREGEDFTASASRKKQQGEKAVHFGVVYGGDEFIKFLSCPELHRGFRCAAFGLGDFREVVFISVAALAIAEESVYLISDIHKSGM